MDDAQKEWTMLQCKWDGKIPMLLDAIREKINHYYHESADADASDLPCTVIQHFWQAKYEHVHEEVIQQSMRFQLR